MQKYLSKEILFCHTLCIGNHMLHLCYKQDVCPFMCLSVTLVDCDHTVQQKVEMGTRQDRSVSWLAELTSHFT